MKERVFVVIPTARSLRFLASWGEEFASCTLLVVEDAPQKNVHVPRGARAKDVLHYDWSDIRRDLGRDEWIFPRRNAGIRSYGFWKSYALGADVIVTLDDDCYPVEKGFIQKHLDNLRAKAPEAWFPTFPHPTHIYTRGYPYDVRDKRRAVVSHGLWSNKMDLDAKTQKKHPKLNVPPYPPIRQFVPPGLFFPMSSMNLAFAREVVPLMYFPLMGEDPQGRKWGYDRYDDIWAGVFVKKILDHLGLAVVTGSPFVEHRKASDVTSNLKKERTGMQMNEELWKWVSTTKLTSSHETACYKELVDAVRFPKTRYFQALRSAMDTWIELFD